MKEKKRVCLVIPTIREDNFRMFVDRWTSAGLFDCVDLLVVEDNPKKTFTFTFDGHCNVFHYSWEDIDSGRHGVPPEVIPRRSDTVRSFGYYVAWKLGYEYIMTLDDDCYPHDGQDGRDVVETHINAMERKTKWFNTLNMVKPRGIPFKNLGNKTNIVLNHGLWTKVLDYDAPTQLVSPREEEYDYKSSIVPHGSFFPMCGMNVMWKADVTVWMYHLMMGQRPVLHNDVTQPVSLERLQFDRFGDIWCGVMMKKLCDMFGYQVTTGVPYIEHQRASDPFTNLMKEANGIAMNEFFWEHIDSFDCGHDNWIRGLGEPIAYEALGRHVRTFADKKVCPLEFRQYFVDLGDAMVKWADCFKR